MERPQVVSRVYDRQEMLLCGKEYRMAMLVSVPGVYGMVTCDAYRSSIISKGGRLSNRPRPSNSPPDWALSRLDGLSVGDIGIQGMAPSSGLLPWSLSDRAVSLPSVPGDEPSVPAPSERAGRVARCLPTFLSRPSTWAGGYGSTHDKADKATRWHTEPLLEFPNILPLEGGFPPGLRVDTVATGPCTPGADWFLAVAWHLQ